MLKWALSENKMSIFGLCYRVYQGMVHTETGLITYGLTFLYISFVKLFCQNKVKKNCKFVLQFLLKNAGVGCWRRHKVYVLRSW